MNSMRLIWGIVLLVLGQSSFAQNTILDKAVAVVGDKVILLSEVEIQYLQMLSEGTATADETTKCYLLDQMIAQKLMVSKAKQDSIQVGTPELDAELERRMRFFVGRVGSEEAFIQYYGKTPRDYMEEYRDDVKQQLLAQKVQSQILGSAAVSPSEVLAYFETIPKDSLPYINKEYEVSQLVLNIEVGPVMNELAKEKISKIRERIVSGEQDLSYFARLYSNDPGSAAQGGSLGFFGRGQMVPEFESYAFKLEPGELSPVFETTYGFHILQVDERSPDGSQVKASHILISPQPSADDAKATEKKLDSIRSLIIAGNMSFGQAAVKFSDDPNTAKSGGLISDPNTGTASFDASVLGQLDPSFPPMLASMSKGDISKVGQYASRSGQVGYRIVQLSDETEPHVLSPEQDYDKIKAAALADKKNKLMQDWLMKYKDKTYIKISDSYPMCNEQLKRWSKTDPQQ